MTFDRVFSLRAPDVKLEYDLRRDVQSYFEKENEIMPGQDGTGPAGQGPMTGGGFGLCGTATTQAVAGQGLRRCHGRGAGRGQRNMFSATGPTGRVRARVEQQTARAEPANRSDQIVALKQQAQDAMAMLAEIQQRIHRLESGAANE